MVPVAPEVAVCGEARLAHDGWVSEFEAFQRSGEKVQEGGSDVVPVSARSGRSIRSVAARSTSGTNGNPTKAMDNLRAEIKLLHWHKLANEAALKAALLKTKKIKAQGGGTIKQIPAMTTLSMPTGERAAWMQQVIEEEQSKPLQVTRHFMSKYEEKEKENEGRLDNEVARHIRSLRNLRQQIEKRGEMKARRAKYRAAQKQLEVEKQQLLLGKLHEKDGGQESVSREPGLGAGAQLPPGQGSRKTTGALDTVLGSLDKLVELERRISSLEKSNVYDNFRGGKQGGAAVSTNGDSSRSMGRRRVTGSVGGDAASRRRRVGRPGVEARNSRLSFSKQRSEATVDGPSQVYYSVRVRPKAAPVSEGSGARNERMGGAASTGRGVGRRVGSRIPSARTRGGASTFLTQLPDVHRHTRAVAGRGGGGGRFRSAIADKKRLEAKRRIAGDRVEALRIARQDRIIRDWMQRKKAATATGNRQRKSSVLSGSGGVSAVSGRTRPSVGSSAAVRGGANTHLQEFRDIRLQYAKRTERLRRDLSRRPKGPEGGAIRAGTRTATFARQRPAGSLEPSRPTKISRLRPRLERGRDVRRPVAMAVGCTNINAAEDGWARGAGQGVRLTVGGTGLKAARARQQEASSFPGIAGTRRRDKSRQQRPVGVLPRLRGTERVDRGTGGGGPIAGVGRW